MKTYLLGLDSVPVWLFETLAKKKSLDAVKWFARNADVKDLRSNMPPVTASAWLTIYTGLSEAKLGVYDFFKLNNRYEMELTDFDSIEGKPFWESIKGRSLVITPAMVTKVTKNPNVDILTGFPAKYKTNNEVMAKFMKECGLEEEPDIERKVESGDITVSKASAILAKKIGLKFELMKKMDSENSYELVFLCITETDRIQHFTLSRGNWEKYMLPLFMEISKVFEYLKSQCLNNGARVIVVSDHGGVATYKKFIINGWLVENGYASIKQGAKRINVSNPILRSIYRNMPKSIKNKVANLPLAGQGFTAKDLDHANTIAFSATSTNKIVPVWINDSRFVSGNDKNVAHKKRLAMELKRLSNIKNVFDGQRYYGKTNKFIVPDLLVEAKDGYTIKTNEISSNIVENVDVFRGGEHTLYGMIGTYPKMLKGSAAYSVRDVKDLVLRSVQNAGKSKSGKKHA